MEVGEPTNHDTIMMPFSCIGDGEMEGPQLKRGEKGKNKGGKTRIRRNHH